jgi:hypothetical protein
MNRSLEVLPGIPLIESPLFGQSIDELGLSERERAVAVQLHERGYALLDFPDDELDQRIERIKRNLAPTFGINLDDPNSVKNDGGDLRIQDGWRFDDDVKRIAANEHIVDLLSKLYGRRAFPFQTLNFPVGTQQALHSDSIHFSSIPERFMCGVWLAFEDVALDAGPLVYVPGSHKWPILSNAMIGRSGSENRGLPAQDPFDRAWQALVDASKLEREVFLPKKGQALIWAANLLHGGARQVDPTLTRWSQVTHYYFENCIYYTPAFSDEALGELDLRSISNISTGEIEPNLMLGKHVAARVPAQSAPAPKSFGFLSRKCAASDLVGLPADFDAAEYYRLNPDVAVAGQDAARHYMQHGREEGRRYRIR